MSAVLIAFDPRACVDEDAARGRLIAAWTAFQLAVAQMEASGERRYSVRRSNRRNAAWVLVEEAID